MNKHKGKKRKKLVAKLKKIRNMSKNNLPKGRTYAIQKLSDLRKHEMKQAFKKAKIKK